MADAQPQKKKIVWVHDKGVNRIGNDRVFKELLNACAASLRPNEAQAGSRILESKDAEHTKLMKYVETSGMKPFECPIARHLGIPLTIYAKPPAGVGEEVKGELNMVSMVLSRGLRDGQPQATLRGRTILALEGPGSLPLDLVVKLLFFLGDLLSDTIGHVSDEVLQQRLGNLRTLFKFYGPARRVKDCQALVNQTKEGMKVFTVEDLRRMEKEQMSQIRVPPVMAEYFKDPKLLKDLEGIVLRGWKPPTSSEQGLLDLDDLGQGEQESE